MEYIYYLRACGGRMEEHKENLVYYLIMLFCGVCFGIAIGIIIGVGGC